MADEQGYFEKLTRKDPNWTYQSVLPTAQDPQGNTHFSLAAGIPGALLSPLATWERMSKGQVQPFTQGETQARPQVNPEIVGAAQDTALNMIGGSPLGTAPKGATRMFLGRNSAGADHAALLLAESMADSGLSKEQIWSETGWFTGEDGHWRYEVPDYAATLNPVHAEQPKTPDYMSRLKGVPKGWDMIEGTAPESTYIPKGGEVSGMLNHPALDKASGYPHWSDVPEGLDSLPYDKSLLSWKLKPEYRPGIGGSAKVWDETLTVARQPETAFRNTLLHELQHAAQHKEGFTNGGSPEQFLPKDFAAQRDFVASEYANLLDELKTIKPETHEYVNVQNAIKHLKTKEEQLAQLWQNAIRHYHNIPGEREARNVERRSNMTPEQLKQNPPWKTEDPILGMLK